MRDYGRLALAFVPSDAVLLATQAALVALPNGAPPAQLQRLAGRGWALIPAGSIAAVIGAIAIAPGAADFLTYLALIATPLLAAVALAAVIPGRRPWLALLVAPALAIAWQAPAGSLAANGAALALTALGCLTLGWLLAAVAPLSWLKVGIVGAAVLDSILVFSDLLQGPNATLNAAAPAAGLPKLQFVEFGSAIMGYGDLFIAAVLGGLLLRERTPQLPVAFICLVLAAAFDLLFFVTNELPATVPVAAALLVSRLLPRAAA